MNRRMLTSCFGLGYLPAAPGSWGSLPPAIVFGLVYYLGGSGIIAFGLMVLLLLAGSIVCVRFSSAAVAATGNKDPNEVVADEIAGQALTFLALPFLIGAAPPIRQVVAISALGYFLFRLFDTIKPWPIYKLEKFPAGWGILADDLMAGVFAAVALIIAAEVWILK